MKKTHHCHNQPSFGHLAEFFPVNLNWLKDDADDFDDFNCDNDDDDFDEDAKLVILVNSILWSLKPITEGRATEKMRMIVMVVMVVVVKKKLGKIPL